MKQEEKKVSVMESCVVGAIKSECLGFGLYVRYGCVLQVLI